MRYAFALSIFAGSLFAQPRIGLIDIYGLHKIPERKVLEALGVSPGDKLPASKGDVEERIEGIDGVVRAHLEAACCEEGQAILYVGIEEKGSPHFDYRQPGSEELLLPGSMLEQYRKFIDAVAAAGRTGRTAEDLTHGHSLMADPAARELQQGFGKAAADHLTELQSVLRRSANAEHRAIAAYIIGYAAQKDAVVEDLLYALTDGDDTVRNNAIRSLAAIAVYARLSPKSGIKIAPTWFIEMLNSVIWSDRNNGAVALVTLTDGRDSETIEQLRTRALPSLVEMAAWKHLAHALPAYILLGRVLGIPEKQLQDTWSRGQRDFVIQQGKKILSDAE